MGWRWRAVLVVVVVGVVFHVVGSASTAADFLSPFPLLVLR